MYQITGNTYPVKDRLRALGCRWNAQARAWETGNPATYKQAMDVVSRVRRKAAPAPAKKDVRIEYPSRGATYCTDEYGVYFYGRYAEHSVLAGQQSRQFLGSYATLEEAQAAHPDATLCGCEYREPYLGHLPEED